jgi:hypothetical protein
VTSWTEDRKEEEKQPIGLTALDLRIRSVTSWTEDRKEEEKQPIGLTALDFRIRSVTSGVEDWKEEEKHLLVLQLWTSGSGQWPRERRTGRGGQQPVILTALDFRIRSVTSWTEDRKEEEKQPVGLTALDFRIRLVTSWTEDRKEEVNSQLFLQLWTSGSGQWPHGRRTGRRRSTACYSYSSGLQDQISDLMNGG